jgi:flagellar biosynthesis/type III secretory pathway protein FliH
VGAVVQGPTRGRVVPRPWLEASLQARQIRAQAESEARALLHQAAEERETLLREAQRQALEQASARLAASWIALREREARADELGLERTVLLARLLAERLLGETLALHPDRVVALAREALRELRRASRITVHACTQDAAQLRVALHDLAGEARTVEVCVDDTRAPGCLRVTSELGTLDADLAPQLHRLAEALQHELGKDGSARRPQG